ncbi:hypothetical protein MAESPC_01751 [Microcystis aeruginosa SPC777]|uniref:Uncharacterized protein n=1 Tax=Microcystis aeruginosa SPC777 TaxID=482300 RepID=S3JD36_MICAE|nr:hypothetical protein MAESPC_01751 [Microcystis aeruginosa SPC777]
MAANDYIGERCLTSIEDATTPCITAITAITPITPATADKVADTSGPTSTAATAPKTATTAFRLVITDGAVGNCHGATVVDCTTRNITSIATITSIPSLARPITTSCITAPCAINAVNTQGLTIFNLAIMDSQVAAVVDGSSRG